MEIEALITKIEEHLSPLLDESGSILYSSVDTIKKGDLYVLGLNPGGDDTEINIPLQNTIADLRNKKTNSYLDEDWSNGRKYAIGQHPLQVNVTGLISSLGYDPGDVFCSNLIFTRSKSQKDCKYSERAKTCWKVHEEFLKIVDPKCLIVFGISIISPFEYLKKICPLIEVDNYESGHPSWKCYCYKGQIAGKNRLLIGVPHLSRYYIIKRKDVIDWIKSKFNEAN